MEPSESTRAMLLIKSIDPSAVLELSDYTGKWYVATRLNESDGVMISGIGEHRWTADGAVLALMERLKAVPSGHVLVGNDSRGARHHWRWNGAAFREEAVERHA